MVIFNKKWKKYNEIQLTKNIMDLNIRKMTNHPPSPELAHGNGERNQINKQTKKARIEARVLKKQSGHEENKSDSLSLPNQNAIIINIIWQYFIKYVKYNEIQLTKNKMDLNNRKI